MMIPLIAVWGVLASTEVSWILESSIHLGDRSLERWSMEEDEERFKVIVKTRSQPSLQEEILEDVRPLHLRQRKTERYSSSFLAPRIFFNRDHDCQAHALISLPNPFGPDSDFILDDLACSDFEPHPRHGGFVQRPRLQWASISWSESADLPCDLNEALCYWRFDFNDLRRLQLQIAGNLAAANHFLQRSQIAISQQLIEITSFADIGNRSYYDANHRQLVLGAGRLPDALDGSVVVHEWAHSLIDDTNPRLWGEQSTLIHEALADFISSNIGNDACIGAFDARDVATDAEPSTWPHAFEMPTPNSSAADLSAPITTTPLCLRYLLNTTPWNPSMTRPPHSREGALVVASALYAVQNQRRHNDASALLPTRWGDGVLLSILLESLIRSPKRILVEDFWAKAIAVAHEQGLKELGTALTEEALARRLPP